MTQQEVKNLLSSGVLHILKSASIVILLCYTLLNYPYRWYCITMIIIWTIVTLLDIAVYIKDKIKYGTNNQGTGENNQGLKGTDQEQG